MAASPAGRHQHGLVIKLPVVTADIEVVAGMVFKVGRQPVHQQGGHHARRHNPAERVINAVQRIVARVDNHQMLSYFFGKTLDAFVQRPASPLAFHQKQRNLFFQQLQVPWKIQRSSPTSSASTASLREYTLRTDRPRPTFPRRQSTSYSRSHGIARQCYPLGDRTGVSPAGDFPAVTRAGWQIAHNQQTRRDEK